MPKVKFLRDTLFESEGRGKGPVYTKGRVYVMSEDQAERWIRRNDAEAYVEAPAPEPEPKKAEAPKQEPVAPPSSAPEPLVSGDVSPGPAVVEDNDHGDGDDLPRRRGRPAKVQPS